MMNSIDSYFRPLETALKARALRQEVLGSNIANADTPNYKARDVDFAALLQGKMGATALAPVQSHAGHLSMSGAQGSGAKLLYRQADQPSIDGNTVDAHQEMARFSENAIHYQALLTFTTARIHTLQQAMQNN